MPNTYTILNIDDVAAMRYGKSHVLRRAGYTVIEAGTGQEGLRLVRELMPDLVLLDVHLPDMSGIDVCRSIKRDPLTRSIPVVQISATFVTDRDQEAGLESGADIYLTEPLEPQELQTVVGVLLRLRGTEAGLAETESRWQRFVDSNVIGVIVLEDDRIVEANDIFLEMLGYTRADLRSNALTWTALTAPEYRDAAHRARSTVFEEGSTPPYPKEYLRRDGRRVAAVAGATMLDRKRRRWMSFVLDVSEQKRVEKEREAALEREKSARTQAEEATRLKDEFLANLSHELRTPMNIIIGWAHLLGTGALDKDQVNRAVSAIERAARSQAQLIEDLLDVSRIVTGKFRMTMRPVDLGPVVEAAAESLRLAAQARQVELKVSREESSPVIVQGDADRLQQVVWNLLSNAVKFTPTGGTVDVRLYESGREAIVSVNDSGIGITPEFLPFVFDRFRQADGTSTREHMGMGLGLAIVRHVTELHGGVATAHSEGPDRGATFRIALPLADAAPPLPVVVSHSGGAMAQLATRARVLLIEDDASAREMTSATLRHSGFEVQTAAGATEALRLLAAWRPDVIVSDIGMPEVDGYEFIRELRNRAPERGGNVPAVALTAYARADDANRALSVGYQRHLPKPLNPQDLAAVIAELVRNPGPQRLS